MNSDLPAPPTLIPLFSFLQVRIQQVLSSEVDRADAPAVLASGEELEDFRLCAVGGDQIRSPALAQTQPAHHRTRQEDQRFNSFID